MGGGVAVLGGDFDAVDAFLGVNLCGVVGTVGSECTGFDSLSFLTFHDPDTFDLCPAFLGFRHQHEFPLTLDVVRVNINAQA